ncbi:MAG: pimelyl-ACP methyl ester esterase BioV [Campylobacteraceae bacterium]|nr:pimelyl-ACP methyl ester esterase BioV [Campylobacteraceae bacterium]
MKFFSGFCFQNESRLFDEYLEQNDFCVTGFSYGAIKAFEYALNCSNRIDKLQLFSPAFFQDKSEKFKKLQSMHFAKDSEKYIEDFLKKVLNSSIFDIKKYYKKGTNEELKELLGYVWSIDKLNTLKQKGTNIEVYLGENDRIINSNSALEFFKPFAQIYYIKNTNHLLV